MAGPLPRLRIYTDPGQYFRVLREWLSGGARAGDATDVLERRIADRLGIGHAVVMPMARTGIYFAVKGLIRPGQKVILSPYTIADVVNMVVCAGGIPVFADVERSTGNIDPAAIERSIDGETGAVLVTHLYGMMADMSRITAICKERRVALIEDAAQSFGGKMQGRYAGTFGDAGIFSFGMYKNVNSFFGGMVVTPRTDLDAFMRAQTGKLPYQPMGHLLRKVASAAMIDVVTFPLVFRNFSFWLFRFAFLNNVDSINNKLKIDVSPEIKRRMPPDYLVRMTPLQARLILSQLDRVEGDMSRRIRAAHRWHAALHDLPELTLAPLRDDGSHIYWYFPIMYRDRHALVAHAMKHGCDITESYHRNCAEMPCFAEFARVCPNAAAVASSLIYLPVYPRYSGAEIDKTAAVIRRFFGK